MGWDGMESEREERCKIKHTGTPPKTELFSISFVLSAILLPISIGMTSKLVE
jgi:hypothetical protein